MKRFWLAALAVALAASPAHARDWFVRAGSEGGDGSKEKPFKDPYLALEKAEAGDAIHVTKGTYHGKLDTGNWTIDVPNVTLLGGYDDAFTTRDPWSNPSELRCVKDSKARHSGTIILGGKDHTGTILDGFVIDGLEMNKYGGDEPYGDIDLRFCLRETLVNLSLPNCQVRNCLIVNSSADGCSLTANGTRFENNIVVNCVAPQLVELRSPPPALEKDAKPAVVKGNTLLFSWSPNYGKGGPDGIGIKVWSGCKAEITDNVIQNCDNHGIFLDTRPDRVVLKNNVFRMNGYDNVKFFMEGRDVAVDDSNMGDMDEVGLKACEGNEAKDPELGGFDPKWMERFINRTAAERGKVKMDDWNKLRQLAGAPLQAEGGKGPSGFAMAWDWTKALKLVPKVKQGAHPKKLEVKLAAAGATASKSYEKATFDQVFKSNGSLDGKAVELVVCFGDQKSQFYYSGVEEKGGWMGVELFDGNVKEPSGLAPWAYFKKGTNAQKYIEGCRTFHGRVGEIMEKFTCRGTVKHDAATTMSQKTTFLIEQVEPYVEQVVDAKRPVGRDWFVRAGSSGNGSKEKPFKDPWQALEKCESGDTIHVAEGEYFGKLKSGYWTIDVPYLALVGGYDKDFTERDPWKHPTRLGFAPDSKSWTEGSYLRGEGECPGFILDGFVLDGKDVNRYKEDGDLRPSESTRHGLCEVNGDGLIVRNCIMVNGSLGSVGSTSAYGLIENNIMINFHWMNLQLTPAVNQRPWVVKNNTLLFSWYDKGGEGHGSVGIALYTRGDTMFEADANIIGYCDEYGIMSSTDAKKVKVTNNVFVKNLFAHYTDMRALVVDDKTMKMFGDAGFAAATGNRCDLEPQLPFDKAWMQVYLGRSMAMPGKVEQNDWNKLRELMGLPQVATGGAAAMGYARAYPWKAACSLFPQNPECKAGARPVKLEAKFEGKAPEAAEEKSYDACEYPTFQNQVDTVDGKSIEVVVTFGEMKESTTYPYLAQCTGEAWGCLDIMGPEGKESGLPTLGFFKHGTRLERALKKTDASSKYKIRGTAHKGTNFTRGTMQIDSIEKVD